MVMLQSPLLRHGGVYCDVTGTGSPSGEPSSQNCTDPVGYTSQTLKMISPVGEVVWFWHWVPSARSGATRAHTWTLSPYSVGEECQTPMPTWVCWATRSG